MKYNKEYHCDSCNCALTKYDIKGLSISFLEGYLSNFFNYPFVELVNHNLKNDKFRMIKRICFAILGDFSSLTHHQIGAKYNLSKRTISNYIDYARKNNYPDYLKIKTQLSKL